MNVLGSTTKYRKSAISIEIHFNPIDEIRQFGKAESVYKLNVQQNEWRQNSNFAQRPKFTKMNDIRAYILVTPSLLRKLS